MLSVPPGVAAALQAETQCFAWLLKISDDLFFTNHSVDLAYAGQTYKSEGDLLGVPAVVRERGIKLQSLTIEFSNADGVMSYYLRHRFDAGTSEYVPVERTGDICELMLVLLDDDGSIIDGSAVSLYKGAFDTWTERDTDSAASISLRITSPWAKPNLTAGRATSDHNQQDAYPNDTFFEFAHEEKNTIGWGAEA